MGATDGIPYLLLDEHELDVIGSEGGRASPQTLQSNIR
jgi:hypothetical protein